jgi:hypothetical protein
MRIPSVASSDNMVHLVRSNTVSTLSAPSAWTMNPDVSIELIQQGYSGCHAKMITLSAGGLTPYVMAALWLLKSALQRAVS